MGKLQQQLTTKINSPQQPTTTAAITTTQQQHLSTTTTTAAAATTTACSSTMPAMPKEKAAAVSLSESNFTELKMKELAMASTAAAATATPAAAASSRLQSSSTSSLAANATCNSSQQRSTCGCGAASATEAVGSLNRNSKFMTNGHSSPLAAASSSGSNTCCRKLQNGSVPRNAADTAAAAAAASTSATAGASSLAAPGAVVTPVTPPRRSARDFIFGKYIGEGSFSIVYLAVDVSTKREYAIKVCEKRQILREHKQENIRREREVMHAMTNVPGFVNLSCTFQDNRSLYFVMTYAPNGDLLPCINRVGSFDLPSARHYAAELVLACEQMHRRNIVHRDLKPENILLDEDMHTLVADFGSSKVLTPEELLRAKQQEQELKERLLYQQQIHSQRRKGYTSIGAVGGGRGSVSASSRQSGSSSSNYASAEESDNDNNNDNNNNNDEEGSESNGGGGDGDTGTGSDDVDSPAAGAGAPYVRYSRYGGGPHQQRRRRGSFVGTAQYVSPEVLQNGVVTPATDLWALGCIVYQMMAGLPPFRGNSDFSIFRQILSCTINFPSDFDPEAEDLVRKLCSLIPQDRLGAEDVGGCYSSIRAHPFFAGIDFATVRQQVPPPIYPFVPERKKAEGSAAATADVVDGSDYRGSSGSGSGTYRVPDHLEPGLNDRQLAQLLARELGTALDFEVIHSEDCGSSSNNGGVVGGVGVVGGSVVSSGSVSTTNSSASNVQIEKIEKKTASKNIFDLSNAEFQRRLEQQKSDKWHVFTDDEVILKKGFVNKRKGLFARKRMLLLTTGPRLIYIDPVSLVKKGEIPWSPELRVEARNFKIFFVHTPNRTYYLEDPEGYSLQWLAALEDVHALTYSGPTPHPIYSRPPTIEVVTTTKSKPAKSSKSAKSAKSASK